MAGFIDDLETVRELIKDGKRGYAKDQIDTIRNKVKTSFDDDASDEAVEMVDWDLKLVSMRLYLNDDLALSKLDNIIERTKANLDSDHPQSSESESSFKVDSLDDGADVVDADDLRPDTERDVEFLRDEVERLQQQITHLEKEMKEEN